MPPARAAATFPPMPDSCRVRPQFRHSSNHADAQQEQFGLRPPKLAKDVANRASLFLRDVNLFRRRRWQEQLREFFVTMPPRPVPQFVESDPHRGPVKPSFRIPPAVWQCLRPSDERLDSQFLRAPRVLNNSVDRPRDTPVMSAKYDFQLSAGVGDWCAGTGHAGYIHNPYNVARGGFVTENL